MSVVGRARYSERLNRWISMDSASEVPISLPAKGQSDIYKSGGMRRQAPKTSPPKTLPEPFQKCDFGVEIGGTSSFEALPRSLDQADNRASSKTCSNGPTRFRCRRRVQIDKQHQLCFRCLLAALNRFNSILLQEYFR